jgi:hypothetical protein
MRLGQDVACGCPHRKWPLDQKPTETPFIDLVFAHPATGCGSDNNGEGQQITCKKATGENVSRSTCSGIGPNVQQKFWLQVFTMKVEGLQ